MILAPSGARVWLAAGHTDMRKGFDGLALLVQETLKRDPHGGHLFVFRGRRGSLLKVLWHDGQGMCLFAKRLERGRRDEGCHSPCHSPSQCDSGSLPVLSSCYIALFSQLDRVQCHTRRPLRGNRKGRSKLPRLFP
jgi:hypothetical protein